MVENDARHGPGFYLGAQLSMISMFGAGIEMGAPKLPVVGIMGDGAS